MQRTSDKKIPISQTRAAVIARTSLYVISAVMMGKALAGLSEGDTAESLGNMGLALIFAGMCFRSSEFAILTYVTDGKKREEALKKLRDAEDQNRPWVGWMVRLGWVLTMFGVGAQLSTLV